jgi:hypothetical protein
MESGIKCDRVERDRITRHSVHGAHAMDDARLVLRTETESGIKCDRGAEREQACT